VQRVAAVEDAIHSTLEARGSERQAPGTEWFDTTVEEIDAIVNFVTLQPL
jgi:T5orf172 domain-containing protein